MTFHVLSLSLKLLTDAWTDRRSITLIPVNFVLDRYYAFQSLSRRSAPC
jgi:hypothetical protein